MMGSLPSSSGISPQMESKQRYWFRKLSTEWWEIPLQADTGKYEEKQLTKHSYPDGRSEGPRPKGIMMFLRVVLTMSDWNARCGKPVW